MRHVSHCPGPVGIRRHRDRAGSPGLTTQFIANFTGYRIHLVATPAEDRGQHGPAFQPDSA
ncbi:MAG TPA: hypothetical protein VGH77_22845 [Streptosporangiaceae bacterium]